MKRYSKSTPNASKSRDFMWVKIKMIRLLLDGKLTVNIHVSIFKRRNFQKRSNQRFYFRHISSLHKYTNGRTYFEKQ